jgi:hypothetical protein
MKISIMLILIITVCTNNLKTTRSRDFKIKFDTKNGRDNGFKTIDVTKKGIKAPDQDIIPFDKIYALVKTLEAENENAKTLFVFSNEPIVTFP